MFCSINTFRHKGVFFPLKFRSVTSAEIPFETPLFVTVQKQLCYSRSNSAKCPASGASIVSEPMLMSQVGEIARTGVRVDQCVSAVRAGLGASIGLLT